MIASPSGVSLPASLAQAAIASLPASAFYIADFITEEEEQRILDKIASAPKPRWKQLTHRRLQAWPSELVNNALLDAPLPAWLAEPVVPRLLSLPVTDTSADAEAGRPSRRNLFAASPHGRPNHVLINEYPPGVGIMPHKDGAAYYPVVCTVSLGGSLCLDIHPTRPDDGSGGGALEPGRPAFRILQEPRSLLVTTGALYTDYMHGIADVDEDVDLSERTVANWALLRSPESFAGGQNARQTRTSLTYRDVMKVSRLGNKLGGLFRH